MIRAGRVVLVYPEPRPTVLAIVIVIGRVKVLPTTRTTTRTKNDWPQNVSPVVGKLNSYLLFSRTRCSQAGKPDRRSPSTICRGSPIITSSQSVPSTVGIRHTPNPAARPM